MFDIALHVGAVLFVLIVFGAPATIALGPDEWRRWWLLSTPIFGLAVIALIQLPLGTMASPGQTAVPALGIALCLGLAAVWRCGLPPRPALLSFVVLLAVAPAGLMAYRPSLRLEEPRPSGVLNEDSVYYLGIDSWLQKNGIRDEPPPPDVDGFYATAHQAWDNHLRIGVDLVNVQVSTVLGVDPLETLPALTATLVALAGLGCALGLISLRGPPWAAVVVALLITSRPETLRLGLDSFVAQAAGVALAPVAACSIASALVFGGRHRVVTAGLLAGGLCAYYVEYAPWLALSGVMLVGALMIRPRLITGGGSGSTPTDGQLRACFAKRLMLIATAAVVLNPLAVYNGAQSLLAGSDLSGEAIVPYFGLLRSLGLVTGPFSVLYVAPEASLFLAAAATVVVSIALAYLPRVALIGMGAALGAVLLFVVHQAYVQEYSYGLYKVLGLAAPLVALALVLATSLSSIPAGARVTGALVVAGLLLINIPASVDISRGSVAAVNGMIPEDADLSRVPSILDGTRRVALEGTDTAGTPNARQHYGLYFLRAYNGQRVTYARGPGSYYTTALRRGPADVDKTYSPDYGGIVSWGPSQTQDELIQTLGGWHIYRRARGPSLLLVGRTGWVYPTVAPDGRPMRWTRGPASLWINASEPEKMRLNLEVLSPVEKQVLRVRVEDEVVYESEITTSVTAVRTSAFTVPRGRTVVSLESSPTAIPGGGDPLGVGLVTARATR